MGFNAADVIPELDWNFEKYGQGKGTVPEPSDKMIEEALRAMAEASAALYKKLGLERPAEMTEEKINEVLAAFPEDFEAIAFADLTVKMIKIFAKLCGNQPSATQLKAIPFRARQAFFLWLMKELRPEAGGGDTTRPPLRLVKPA